MNIPDWTVFDEYGNPVRPRVRLLPLRRRNWWHRHHETVIALAIILAFMGYMAFEIIRAHMAGRL